MLKAAAIILLLRAATPVSAQVLMPEPFGERSVSVELMRPMLESGDLDALSFGGFIYTRLPLGRAHFIADLPVAHLGNETGTSSGIGNVMLGLEGTSGRATIYGTLRLPTASDDEFANVLGLATEFHRLEAWLPELMSFSVGAILRDRRESNGGFDFQFGAGFVKPDEGHVEVLLDYGAQYVYRPRAFGITAGLQGRAFATGSGNFADRTLHDFRMRFDYTTARVRPAIGFSIPLDRDLRLSVNWVLRLGLQLGI